MNTRRPPGHTNNTTLPSQTPKQTSQRSSSVSHQQSLNHLLNFSLPPRVQHVQATPRRSKKATHQAWNPERFINAQYRFVMRPTGDYSYTVHFADPDIYFQWQDILQVIVPQPPLDQEGPDDNQNIQTCPICLSQLVAPRMTKCGHVFCYPCIIHYIETGNTPKWHRCPICFDSITAAQLKSVRWSSVPPTSFTPSSGTPIPMRLMQRPQITTLALPRSDTWQATALPNDDLLEPHEAPFHFIPDVEQFARFMLASPEQIIADITTEIDALDAEEKSLLAGGDDLGASFVVRARDKCLGMLIKAQEMELDAGLRQRMEKKKNLLQEALNQAKARRRREEASAALGTSVDRPSPSSGQAPTDHIQTAPAAPPRPTKNKRNNLNPPPHSSSSYYFYQAASGSNIFLHPLDIRILLAHFGSYAAFPDNIIPLVESASESTVDDDIRRRCKYLGHLPESADVVFVEVDLESVVGGEALKPFENLLKTRRLRHKERARKEDRARSRAEEKERDTLFTAISSSSAFTTNSSHPTVTPSFPPSGNDRAQGTGTGPPASFPAPIMSIDVDYDLFPSPENAHHLRSPISDDTREDYPDLTLDYERANAARSPSVPRDTPEGSSAGAVTNDTLAHTSGRGMIVSSSGSASGDSAGAWGARSFASAAQTDSSGQGRLIVATRRGNNSQTTTSSSGARPLREEDEWEIDQAWHELEEAQLKIVHGRGGGNNGGSNGGGTKRNRGKKLVLLGSGAHRGR